MSATLLVRWLHVMSATAWFGEVVTINFVLVPALLRLPRQDAADLLAAVFPTLFRLASVLAALTVLSGSFLAWSRFSADPSMLWMTASGRAFLVGASIGLSLAAFHFVLEPRLEGMICVAARDGDLEVSDRVIRLLRLVPRGGLVVISSALLLMMVGARGW